MIENIINNKEVWGDDKMWSRDGHEWSDHVFGTTENMWNNFIYPRICMGLKGEVLEIAPGYGRVTEKLLTRPINLQIIDLNENCIEACKIKFKDKVKNYYINNGKDLSQISDNSLDFVLSWDSFVHMNQEVIESYINEINRVLKPEGIGWIHHSNLEGGQEDNFKNLGGRSNMTPKLMKEIIENQNMEVIHQEYIQWIETLDTITTFKKTKN